MHRQAIVERNPPGLAVATRDIRFIDARDGHSLYGATPIESGHIGELGV
jgi:hypothetical protein